jgi:hypothetical protein
VFEAAVGLIGDWTDTWTDVVLTASGSTLAAPLLAKARREDRAPRGASDAGPGAAGRLERADGRSA